MLETATSAIAAYVPNATATLPFVGTIDIQKLVVAIGIFVVLTAIFWFIRMIVLVRLESLAKRSVAQFDDTVVEAVQSIRPWVYSLIALYAALNLYTFPTTLDQIITAVLYLTFVWQGIQIIHCFIRYVIVNYIEKDEDGDGEVDPASTTAADLLTLISEIILWVFGIIFVLSNVGIEVTSLIAGLGIGGIAIAFALQGVLTDLFASFSIYFDKPFRVGDFVVIGADSGTVEKIGVKSTRIRTLQGEELVVSNTELTTVRVQNFKKMEERRVSSEFGITYETPQDKVKMVNGIVERIFEDIAVARLDRTHFTTFADSALLFSVVYYIESSEYVDFLDAQQYFNLTLMERFAELGIEFAYPTQTIYHKQVT